MEKSKQAMKEALGSRVDDMVCLHTLYTKPAKQGRGYASALVREVTKIVRSPYTDLCLLISVSQADEQQRATFLFSSNIANTGFYNSVGFVEKGRFVLGEDDPTWKEDPVIVLVVCLYHTSSFLRCLLIGMPIRWSESFQTSYEFKHPVQ